MKRDSTAYTFIFAAVICVVCSFSLAAVSEGLRTRKELNMALDIKKNILKAVALKDPVPAGTPGPQILAIYQQKISEVVVDDQGKVLDGKTPADIQEGEKAYPLYIYREGGQVMAYCFPIVGKGLWSTLYGYFALEPDAVTVRGITFYKHGETPGLGAEIEQAWFQDHFKGKKIWDMKEHALHPVAVVKGKVADHTAPEERDFYVDGISGATMTGKGVTAMLDKWLHIYEPYFSKIRSKG